MYDREHYVIHRLGPEVAAVWQLADGKRDLNALAAESGARDVETALKTLAAMNLMREPSSGGSRATRRRLFGVAAGAAAAGTFIPAFAMSCTNNASVPAGVCPGSGMPDTHGRSRCNVRTGRVECCGPDGNGGVSCYEL